MQCVFSLLSCPGTINFCKLTVEPVSTQRALMQLSDMCSMSQQNIIRNNLQQMQQPVLLKFLSGTLLKGLKAISKDPVRCSAALKKKSL